MKNALIKFYGSNLTNHLPAAVPCMGMYDGGYVANFGDIVDWVEGCELAVELLCEMSTNNCITIEGVDSFDLLYDSRDDDNLDFIAHDLDSLNVVDGRVYSFGEVVNYLSECTNHETHEQAAIKCASNLLQAILNGSIEVKSL